MRTTRYIIAVGLVMLWGGLSDGWAQSGIVDQKTELKQLENEIKQSRARLDSLQAEEDKINKEISGYTQRLDSDRKVIGRLEGELRDLHSQVVQADSTLDANQVNLERVRRKYLGDLRHFYMSSASVEAPSVAQGPDYERELNRRIVYLNAIASFESSNVQSAVDLLAGSVDELDNLQGKQSEVKGLKRQRENRLAIGQSQRERSEKSLDQVRRRSMDEADRIITLQKAAEEMAELIARLERQQDEGETTEIPALGEGVFAGLRGQLSAPFKGKIEIGFGMQTDPVRKLKTFSPGVTIKGRPGVNVRLVAPGVVAHSGFLRGYGNFVIIDHGYHYYSTYAGLEKVLVTEGEYLSSRAVVGVSGSDGRVRFELRNGREPLDPVEWINVESF